jgi:hypothetical protein
MRTLKRGANTEALFISGRGSRITFRRVEAICKRAAARVGLHDSQSNRLDKEIHAPLLPSLVHDPSYPGSHVSGLC